MSDDVLHLFSALDELGIKVIPILL